MKAQLSLTGAALLLLASALLAQDVEQAVDQPVDQQPPSLDQQVPVADDPEPEPEATGEVAGDSTADDSSDGNVVDFSADLPPSLSPDATDEDKLAYEFERYKLFVRSGTYDEADATAKRVVELALKTRGPESIDFAKALTNLAIVQHKTEQYDPAQQNFESAIEIIEQVEDRLNEQLVNPLKGLGSAQLESGRPDLAKDTFQRAVHVTHVNEGPHNLDQIYILESLAEADLRMGNIEGAAAAMDRVYDLNRRRYSSDSMELVDPLMKRAAWQHRAGFILEERVSLRHAIRILEAHEGKTGPDLVEPLLQLGRSYFYADASGNQYTQSGTFTSGEIYFKRALRIARETENPDWRIISQASLALGDHYMFQGNDQRARKIYKDLWYELSGSGDDEQIQYRKAVLESHIALSQRQLPQFVATDENAGAVTDEPALEGEVAMAYTISSRGRAIRLRIIEAEPVEFSDMVRSVQRELRTRVYRPQFVDAEPVNSDEQLLTHTFYYRQSDLDKIRAERAARN